MESAKQGGDLGGEEGEGGEGRRRGRHNTESAAPGAPGRAASFAQKAAHVASHCSMSICRHARLRDPGEWMLECSELVQCGRRGVH